MMPRASFSLKTKAIISKIFNAKLQENDLGFFRYFTVFPEYNLGKIPNFLL